MCSTGKLLPGYPAPTSDSPKTARSLLPLIVSLPTKAFSGNRPQLGNSAMPSTPARPTTCTRYSHRLNGPYHALRRTAFVNNCHLVGTALQLATALHHGQRREAGGPYIYHPIRVTQNLWRLGIREEYILAAALLHDTLEDCDARLDKKMLARFYALDPRTIVTVQTLTKSHPHNADQYYGRIFASTVASLVKLADRADNLATMNGTFTQERARKYIEESKCYIMPLARLRLTGNGHCCSAFEALEHEILILTRKAEQDFRLTNGEAKPPKCHVRKRTDKTQSAGTRYFALAKPRTSASSTPYGSPTAP